MNNLYNILKKEIKEMFRDKKSLTMMLVIPLLIPLIVIGMSAFFDYEMNKPVDEYNKIGFNYELDEVQKNIAAELNIEFITGTKEDLKEKYENGEIDLYIYRNENNYIINKDDDTSSAYAYALMEKFFNSYKNYLETNYLIEHNVNAADFASLITIETNEIKSENFYSKYIVNYAFLFIIMAITVSATYPATDTTAGEKERGTLETLLTFPIRSKDIIIGKFLGVSLSSIITGLLSLALAMLSLFISNNVFDIYKDVSIMIPFWGLIFAIIVIVAYSFLISGLCIAIASKSKTFKEAQSALTPLTFISFFPGMIAFMINMESSTILSMIPFINHTLIFSDIISNNINYVQIILMLISTIVIISVLLSIIIKQYNSEDVLFGN